MSGWGTLAVWGTGAVVVVAAAFVGLGAERVWGAFGPADLGGISFETLQRRSTPNDALAAPAGLGTAAADITPLPFAVDVEGLRLAFHKAISGEQRLVRVGDDAASLTERYIQRTALLGFPDTIVVRFMDAGAGRSTIALYSRSQLGRSDFGTNKARLERWLGQLVTSVS